METVTDYVLKECFSINLKWYRINRGFTQEKLAELSNLTPKYISDLERGKFSPSLAKIESIAHALKLEPYYMLKPDHMNDANDIPSRINSKTH